MGTEGACIIHDLPFHYLWLIPMQDVFTLTVESSDDQHGSRVIQQKLENATSKEQCS